MTWNCPTGHVSKASQAYEQSPVIAAEHKQHCLSLRYLLKVGRDRYCYLLGREKMLSIGVEVLERLERLTLWLALLPTELRLL